MMTYEERVEKDYKKALEGGKEMFEKSQELTDRAVEMILKDNPSPEDFKESARLLGEAKMLEGFYYKMFY